MVLFCTTSGLLGDLALFSTSKTKHDHDISPADGQQRDSQSSYRAGNAHDECRLVFIGNCSCWTIAQVKTDSQACCENKAATFKLQLSLFQLLGYQNETSIQSVQ